MELDLFYTDDLVKERHSFQLIPCAGSWLKCSACCQHRSEHYDESFSRCRQNDDDDLHFLNCVRNHSELPTTSSKMSKKSAPLFVYQRRKKNKPSDDTKSKDGATVPGQDPLTPVSECILESIKTPVKPTKRNIPKTSLNEYSSDANPASEEVLVDLDRVSNICSVNDNCSSSISDLKHSSASFKIGLDDSEKCPFSDPKLSEKVPEDMSERDTCITVLRSQGQLDTVQTGRDQSAATENANGVSDDNYCLISCKICGCVGSTSRMLVCDSCEDAFHISCCSSQVIPDGEWHCGSCLKKKHVKLKERSINDLVNNNSDDLDNDQDSTSQGNLGSLAFMFTETVPYMSKVRVGDGFQASVPDWCGPCDDKGDLPDGQMEMNYSNNIFLEEQQLTKSSKLSSIGNWIQCRAIIEGTGEGVDGTSCEKWRRAPLFEVQTDNWECFRCVLWDPAHADCAVPQELSNEDVMRQLKYTELLRPRLAAKRRKFICSENKDLPEHASTVKHHLAAKKKKISCSKNVDSQNQAIS